MRDAFEGMGCASRMGRNPNLSLLQQRTQKSNPNLPFPSIASLSLHRAAMEAGAAAPPHASRPARREQGQPPPGADSPPQIRAPAASSPGHGGAHPRASSSVSAAASAQASPRWRAPTGRAQQLHAGGCASDSASVPAAARAAPRRRQH